MKRMLTSLMAFAVVGVLGGATHAADSGRLDFSLNPDWKFIKQDVSGAEAVGFADSSWTTVSCPHTFNDVDTFDDFSPGGHVGELKQWAGRTWYRKHFTADASWEGKKIYVEFEGVRQLAEVYINGQKIGMSNTGFTPFGFDLTLYVKFGQENVLAVMADNTFVTHGREKVSGTKPNEEIVRDETSHVGPVATTRTGSDGKARVAGVPWNDPHWHPAHGGIYRNVKLHVMDKLHVTLPLYSNLGTQGTYVFASEIRPGTDAAAGTAKVTVKSEVENDYDEARDFACVSEIVDPSGKVVKTLSVTGHLGAYEKKILTADDLVQNPLLWSPGSPNLYSVVTTIRPSGSDAAVDSSQVPLGIRDAKFTVDKGFWINGEHVKLHGFGQKPTDEWAGLGAAQPDWLHAFTLNLMKQDNANFVRWGHCASGPAMINASDRLGIVTYQPGCDGENDPVDDTVPELVPRVWKLRCEAFRDVLIYYRNNPSILIWEVANKKLTEPHIQEIVKIEREWDPNGGRVVTMRRPDATDGKYLDICTGTEGGHEIRHLPMVEGEYDREESPRRVWDNFSPPNFGYKEANDANKAGKKQTWNLNSEEFAVDQAVQYQKISPEGENGGAKWVFSDTTSGGRMTVEVTRTSGQVDGVRLPKEAYYATQVIFSDTPALHIIGHWTYPAKTEKTVYVMSNCDEVELLVNGKSIGDGRRSNDYLFEFSDVEYAAGKIEARGYKGGKIAARQTLKTAGAPAAVKLTPIVGPTGFHADGADVALFDAEVVDKDGNRCPTVQERVDFTTTGPVIWRGGYNSGKENSTNNTYVDLECGINRVAVRSTLMAGTVQVTATVKGLPPASATVEALPVSVKDGMVRE